MMLYILHLTVGLPSINQSEGKISRVEGVKEGNPVPVCMKVWLGHYLGNAQEWFVVFANSKDEAVNFVDCEIGEPDFDSIRPLRHPGMIGFQVKTGYDDVLDFTMDESKGDSIVFHGDEERIEKVIAKGPKTLAAQEVSSVAGQLGVSDPRVFATYLPECPKCAKRHRGDCAMATP